MQMFVRRHRKCVGNIAVEYRSQRLPYTLLLKPLYAVARSRDAHQVFACADRMSLALAHQPVTEAGTKDPLDIAFHHSGRCAEPDGVDKDDNLAIFQHSEFCRHIVQRHEGFGRRSLIGPHDGIEV